MPHNKPGADSFVHLGVASARSDHRFGGGTVGPSAAALLSTPGDVGTSPWSIYVPLLARPVRRRRAAVGRSDPALVTRGRIRRRPIVGGLINGYDAVARNGW